MIELFPAGRAVIPGEVGSVEVILIGNDGTFITGSDFLTDGGVTASNRQVTWLITHTNRIRKN